MKTKLFLTIALIGILMGGCFVKSLHPFYKENDLYFDNTLIGKWIDKDSSFWEIKQIYVSYGEGEVKKEYKNNGYVVGHYDKQDERILSYDVFLFKINNQIYADFSSSFFPTFKSDDDFMNEVHTHNLAKVNVHSDEISFTFFNGEWLAELIQTNKIRIEHEFVNYPEPISIKYKGEYVLTASTDELQKFIAKYGNDPKAFASSQKKLEDGTYQWNAGNGYYTGKMKFGNSAETSITLRKVNEK